MGNRFSLVSVPGEVRALLVLHAGGPADARRGDFDDGGDDVVVGDVAALVVLVAQAVGRGRSNQAAEEEEEDLRHCRADINCQLNHAVFVLVVNHKNMFRKNSQM